MEEEREIQPEADAPESASTESTSGESAAKRSARRASRVSGEAAESEARAADRPTEQPEAATVSQPSQDGGTLPPPPTVVLQAERLLDEALVWGAAFGAVLAQRARRLVARAREEVEDLFAEAEAVRSQWRSHVRQRSHTKR
ncbi:MAG: hypothetical protein N2Z82_00230 [Thermomicrobium sp.]|nr:hypothetical protein [Thermomicrobium sp.]